LAALLLKFGVYGLIRVNPCPSFFNFFFFSLLVWGFMSVIFCSLLCFSCPDVKALIAYSSVAHMGLVVGCFYFFSLSSVWGIVLLSLGHGFVSASLFSSFGKIYLASLSRSVLVKTGLGDFNSLLRFFFGLICCCKFSFPPFLSFFSEIYIFSSLGILGS